MTTALDIYRSANELIKRHGDEAPIFAAIRADAMLEAGDMDGRAAWLWILEAVRDLLNEEAPTDTDVVH